MKGMMRPAKRIDPERFCQVEQQTCQIGHKVDHLYPSQSRDMMSSILPLVIH